MTHHSTTASTRAHPYDAMRVRPCRTLTVVLYTEPRCSSYVRSERFVAVGAAARRPATALHRHPARYKAAAAAHVGRDIEHRALALAVHGGTSPRRHDVGARATGRRRAQLSDSRKGGNAGWKAAYRVAMQRWHPDKFSTRFAAVFGDDKDAALEAAARCSTIAQAITAEWGTRIK